MFLSLAILVGDGEASRGGKSYWKCPSVCGGLGGGLVPPRIPCFFGGKGGGLMRILPAPLGGGSGTKSNSALELERREFASDEQDRNGDAGDSLGIEKSTGNCLLDSTDCAFPAGKSISTSLFRTD